MKKIGLIVLIILVVVGGFYFIINDSNHPREGSLDTAQEPSSSQRPTEPPNFANPKKGAHFETSTPAHSSTLAATPVDVVIDFNFDLASNSTIKIEKDGKDFGAGLATVDGNKLAMRRKMAIDAPDGLYTVNYNGCWPDRSCHEGHFQFAIDRGILSTYQDKRGTQEVTVRMSQIKFQPMNLRISPNTKVTWVNDDAAEHYVNTDSHPAHTHVSGLNSRAIAKGASYSYTYAASGAYPYHCSAHAADMTGNVVVE